MTDDLAAAFLYYNAAKEERLLRLQEAHARRGSNK